MFNVCIDGTNWLIFSIHQMSGSQRNQIAKTYFVDFSFLALNLYFFVGVFFFLVGSSLYVVINFRINLVNKTMSF